MADLSELQAAQTVKIVGASSSGLEQSPINSTSDGALFVMSVNELVPASFSEVEITAVNGNNDPTTIIYRNGVTTVATLTIVYDGNGDIQKVTRS